MKEKMNFSGDRRINRTTANAIIQKSPALIAHILVADAMPIADRPLWHSKRYVKVEYPIVAPFVSHKLAALWIVDAGKEYEQRRRK